MRAIGFARRILFAGCTGYVLYFFSERVFWSHWRPNDSILEYAVTWTIYSLAAEICLVLFEEYRVRALPAIFVVGAIFGWLIEAIVTGTLFGADGIPFPITIAWTGLAWHALISFLVGWYWLQLALEDSWHKTAIISALLGMFWGLWSLSWGLDGPMVALDNFLVHAFASTLILICAFMGCRHFNGRRPGASLVEKIILGLLIIAGAFVIRPAFSGWIAIPVLLILFGGSVLLLRKNAKGEIRPDILHELTASIPLRNLSGILIMPVLAGAIYATDTYLPTNFIIFGITTLVGTGAFFYSAYKMIRT